MIYLAIFAIVFGIMVLVSAGWYFIFKRFEWRMSTRFNDLVARSNEELKSFANILEIQGILLNNLNKATERIINTEHIIINEVQKELDLVQGLLLVIKHDRFLDHVSETSDFYHREGILDEAAIERVKGLLKEFKLDNLSRY